jgi:hypothetical protein
MKPILLLTTLCAALVSGCDAADRALAQTGGAGETAPAAAKAPAAAPGTTNATPAVADGDVALPKPPPELPAPVQEVVQLAQNTLGEQVQLDFVATINEPYALTADHIVYLKDLGVAEPVIAALLKRQIALGVPAEVELAELAGSSTNAPSDVAKLALTNAPGSNVGLAQAPVVTQAVPNAPVQGEMPGEAQPVATEQPATVNYNVFYQSLSPYGTWVEVADYGWCWQPTVATINVGWRPYSDNGRWVWSSAGWYWSSGYSWGWAPFHYGRWASVPSRGWCWVPGTVWGPSWVSWRHTHDHFGWAPLPPSCGWASGVGLTWHGSRVSVGFSFGLAANDYCFVPSSRFYDPHCYRYRVSGSHVTQIYQNSTVVNNYINGNNNTVIINNGVSRDVVQKHTREEIRPVALADARRPVSSSALAANGRGTGARAERIEVYRPRVTSDKAVTRPPETILARQEARPLPASLRTGASASPASRATTVTRPSTSTTRQELRPVQSQTSGNTALESRSTARPTLGARSSGGLPLASSGNSSSSAQRPDPLANAQPGRNGGSAAQLHGRSESRPVQPSTRPAGTVTTTPANPATGPAIVGRTQPTRPAVGRTEPNRPTVTYPGTGNNLVRPQTQPAPVNANPSVSAPVSGRSESLRPLPQQQVPVRRDTPAVVRPQTPVQSYQQPTTRPDLTQRYTPPPAVSQQARQTPQPQYQQSQPRFEARPQVQAPRAVPQQQYSAPARNYAPQAVAPSSGAGSNRGGGGSAPSSRPSVNPRSQER